MEYISSLQETGTVLGWIAFLIGGGIAYGKLANSIESIKYDIGHLKTGFDKFTDDYVAFKIDTKSRLGAIRRKQDSDES